MSSRWQIHFHPYGPGSSRANAFLQNVPLSFPCTSLGLPTTLLHLHPTHISASSCTYTSLHTRHCPLSPPFANLRPPFPCPHWRLPHYHLMLVPTRHPLPCACHHTPPVRGRGGQDAYVGAVRGGQRGTLEGGKEGQGRMHRGSARRAEEGEGILEEGEAGGTGRGSVRRAEERARRAGAGKAA